MAAIAMVTACVSWAQAIYLDNYRAVHDSRNNIWLCSVPQALFGNDWEATITLDPSWTEVVVDGVAVIDGDPVMFNGITGGRLYPFKAQAAGQAISGNITFTWLPVLELNGNFSNEYAAGTVSLNDPDGNSKSDMDGSNEIDISDVTALINYILTH